MTRVLFVDDEPMLLDALRNALHRQRQKWEMVFVTSGEAALAAMTQCPFDVIVSDMRMPGMDGATLLHNVRSGFPKTARVVLSGQASQEELLRATPTMQQFLSKPCELQLLRETVDRVGRVQNLMHDERIQAVVGALDRLPSFPESYRRLTALMEDDSSNADDIVEVVQSDAALSTKLLQLANSAYFGHPGETVAVQQAVRRVGIDLIRALALSAQLCAGVNPAQLAIRSFATLADRSLYKAQLSARFVEDRALADEAFTAALLLDVGQLVLAGSQGETYANVLREAEDGERSLHSIEQQRLGLTHAEVGAYLLGIWGLPIKLVECVARHHAPTLLDSPPGAVFVAVHMADVLVDAVHAGASDPLQALDPVLAARLDVVARLPAALSATVELIGSRERR